MLTKEDLKPVVLQIIKENMKLRKAVPFSGITIIELILDDGEEEIELGSITIET